jgi:ATP-dependent helicase/nuclease subunit A
LADTELPLKSNVTLAIKNFEEEVLNSRILFPDETTDNEKGNIAHKIMEHFDFSSNKTVGEQASQMVVDGIIEQSHLDKVNTDRMEKAVSLSGLRELSGYSLYREKGFLTEVCACDIFPEIDTNEKVVLQGVIDLLAVGKTEAIIVDYKYSTLNKDGLVGKYKKQLELYAWAVERVLGKKVAAKKIVNIFTGEYVEIP